MKRYIFFTYKLAPISNFIFIQKFVLVYNSVRKKISKANTANLHILTSTTTVYSIKHYMIYGFLLKKNERTHFVLYTILTKTLVTRFLISIYCFVISTINFKERISSVILFKCSHQINMLFVPLLKNDLQKVQEAVIR